MVQYRRGTLPADTRTRSIVRMVYCMPKFFSRDALKHYAKLANEHERVEKTKRNYEG